MTGEIADDEFILSDNAADAELVRSGDRSRCCRLGEDSSKAAPVSA